MKQKAHLLTACLIFLCSIVKSQCLTAPVFPVCTGTEPLVAASDNIGISETKYFYGSAATLSNVKLSGGTLVVCGDLTLTELAFDSGVIFIQPTAILTVNNSSGLITKGNTSVYNCGSFQCLGNYVMDGTYATASQPNVFINVSLTSKLKMQNQYFVINNPNSKFINNGMADFHGLITDPQAATDCVCLGSKSQTRMTVLYNKAKYPYTASGPACVSVNQFSQFYDTLTTNPNINFCLASTHKTDSSCIAWGCKPNAWGGGQVATNCSDCSTILTALLIFFKKLEATAYSNYNQISWQTDVSGQKKFHVLRSNDGNIFSTIDSVESGNKTSYAFRDFSFQNNCYYKIVTIYGYKKISSNVIEVKRKELTDHVFPNPFKDYVVIPLRAEQKKIFSIKIMDAFGRKINSYRMVTGNESTTLYLEKTSRGIYLITINDGKQKHTYKLIKE